VPATEAEIGRVDRIFTRVGASDNLARGQSTFLVEMTETAKILNSCTNESLVILDEVGRGTSTHDGMSLAWAVLEHLHDGPGAHPRTLFATHYHELTVLEESLSRLQNLTVEVREWQDEIIFLHKLKPGRADKSYGIQVARLAGLPPAVIERALQLLAEHERMESALGSKKPASAQPRKPPADLFTDVEKRICDALRSAPANLSPEAAARLLAQLRKQL
jgi:DNA mismatch repair protein MutS